MSECHPQSCTQTVAPHAWMERNRKEHENIVFLRAGDDSHAWLQVANNTRRARIFARCRPRDFMLHSLLAATHEFTCTHLCAPTRGSCVPVRVCAHAKHTCTCACERAHDRVHMRIHMHKRTSARVLRERMHENITQTRTPRAPARRRSLERATAEK